MPIFVYECKKCGEKFELLMGVTAEKPKMLCPKCQSKKIIKLLSTSNISMGKSSSGGSCSSGCCSLWWNLMILKDVSIVYLIE